jgi:sterol desaturase/sphingolipid hydroxylase (fatty acid hydroxylase superfamily)
MIPKPELMSKMFKEAFIGQFISGPVIIYFLFDVFKFFGMWELNASLPNFLDLMKTFMIAHMFNDFGFYWTHRLMHSKSIYKYWHKQHHEFTGTIGFAAEYAHPLEVIISNQIPTIGGVLLFGCHPICVVIWIGMRLRQTYEAHSGYCFVGTFVNDYLWLITAESAAFHDHHHTSNQGNFGCNYTDYLFGTMDHWVSVGGEEGYINLKMKNSSGKNDSNKKVE